MQTVFFKSYKRPYLCNLTMFDSSLRCPNMKQKHTNEIAISANNPMDLGELRRSILTNMVYALFVKEEKGVGMKKNDRIEMLKCLVCLELLENVAYSKYFLSYVCYCWRDPFVCK